MIVFRYWKSTRRQRVTLLRAGCHVHWAGGGMIVVTTQLVPSSVTTLEIAPLFLWDAATASACAFVVVILSNFSTIGWFAI
jgi:hypothetical protein